MHMWTNLATSKRDFLKPLLETRLRATASRQKLTFHTINSHLIHTPSPPVTNDGGSYPIQAARSLCVVNTQAIPSRVSRAQLVRLCSLARSPVISLRSRYPCHGPSSAPAAPFPDGWCHYAAQPHNRARAPPPPTAPVDLNLDLARVGWRSYFRHQTGCSVLQDRRRTFRSSPATLAG